MRIRDGAETSRKGSADARPYTGQNLDTTPMAKIFDYFYLEPGTRDFIGHAMALHLDDS